MRKHPRPASGPPGTDGIDEHVQDVVLEQVAWFQGGGIEPWDAMCSLSGSIVEGDSPWSDVADLVEQIYRGDLGLAAKRDYSFSRPKYKNWSQDMSKPSHAYRPRAKTSERAKRRCLYCGKDFDSSHIGNRICKGCTPSVNKGTIGQHRDSP